MIDNDIINGHLKLKLEDNSTYTVISTNMPQYFGKNISINEVNDLTKRGITVEINQNNNNNILFG